MSLKVQLPLNGNTNNQGVDGITLSGSPASYSAGKIGTAATQNGSVGNVVYNNTTAYNYTDNFSFALWIYPIYTGSTAQYAFTVGRADAGGYGYGLQVYIFIKMEFYIILLLQAHFLLILMEMVWVQDVSIIAEIFILIMVE